MSDTITQAFVQQWDDTIRLNAQQKVSRLEATVVDRGQITGESFTANFVAPLDDTPEVTNRHGDTVWSEITHSTRVGLMRDFYQALPVDRNDRPKLLANPNGAYQESLIAAWNRRKDALIYRALMDAAQLKSGGTATVPGTQIVVHGNTGMTKAKLLQAKGLFRKNEADEHNSEELFILYNSVMLEDLLTDTQLTSADFMAVKLLQEGDLKGKWLGFNWIPYERLDFAASTYTTVAYTRSAVHKGMGFVEGKAQTRADKRDTWQVSMAGSFGAVRVEETRVVKIEFQ